MASEQRTVEQRRGKHAWDQLEKVKEQNLGEEYRSLVRKLPSYIMLTGLGQTLAFLASKAGTKEGKAHRLLEQHLSSWVLKESDFLGLVGEEKGREDSLLQWILGEARTSDDYRRATTEVLAYLAWIKRFAEALVPEKVEP